MIFAEAEQYFAEQHQQRVDALATAPLSLSQPPSSMELTSATSSQSSELSSQSSELSEFGELALIDSEMVSIIRMETNI